MAYRASEVFGNELNVKAVVYIHKHLCQSRWRKKDYIIRPHAIAPFIFRWTCLYHAPEMKVKLAENFSLSNI